MSTVLQPRIDARTGPPATPLLELRGITKLYRGVTAVNAIDFTLRPAEVHAIVGENGAGKSTLTKIIAGAVPPTSGEMLLDGKPVAFSQPAEALQSLNFPVDPAATVAPLGAAQKQMVEITRAVEMRAPIIIFDEPTRGVDVGAIAEIHHLINRLADDGLAVLVISSYLPEILSLSDRILVFRQGRVVEEFTASEATQERITRAAVH